MIKTISNDYLTVNINTLGAEVTRVLSNEGVDYIWNGDEKYWKRHAPILFPIVGRLMNDEYTYKGKTYHMGQHGFARDMEFNVVDEKTSSITFELKANSETKELYPFDFRLEVNYELVDHKLKTNLHVFNEGQEEMLFSIGAHPAFNVPLNGAGNYNDYKVELANKKSYDEIFFKAPYADFNSIKSINLTEPVYLSHEMFYDDAKVLKINDVEITSMLSSDKTEHGVSMTAYTTEYGGIWSSKDAPFVCLEPWWGITDSINSDGKLENKVGINRIDKKTDFEAKFDLLFF